MSLGPALGAALGSRVPRREIDVAAMGRDRQHHGGLRRQRGDEPERRCAAVGRRLPSDERDRQIQSAAPARVVAVVRNFGWAW